MYKVIIVKTSLVLLDDLSLQPNKDAFASRRAASINDDRSP
ncbi:hypothetical protein [Microcoleus sp. S13C4]